jgi:fructose-specific phosphotransferase system IIC component
VDWVFEETSKESAFRRDEVRRVNTFTFIERVGAQCFGLVIGCTSLYVAYSLAMAGHDLVAGVIGGTTVVGLVTAFVIGSKKST